MNAKFGLAVCVLAASVLSAAVYAQTANMTSTQGPVTDAKCAVQHEARPGVSAASILAEDYEIKSSVPGGLWLQKKKDAFYCNAGLVAEGDTMCWQLVRPMNSESCADARRKSSVRPIGS